MVRWKGKERKEGEPHQQCRLLVYLLPFLTLQLLLKTPTHTHTLPHTHTTHTYARRWKKRGEGGESAGREYIGKGEWKITAPAKGPRPKSLLPIELCVCIRMGKEKKEPEEDDEVAYENFYTCTCFSFSLSLLLLLFS